MATTGNKTTIEEDGVAKEAYTIAFTNGALQELEDLQKKLNVPDVNTVVRVAINLLQRLQGNDDGTQNTPQQ